MASKNSRAERRRQERQRKQILNILVFTGIALVVAGFFLYMSNRPVDDLNDAPVRTSPVPINEMTIGNPDAPVLVEVFEDFQCPSCLRFTEDFEPLILQNYVYNGVARFTFRYYPFIGAESFTAANGAMCANEQGKFWEFHDILFANQLGENIGAFSGRRLEAMANKIGLDVDAWNDCADSERYETFLSEEIADGRARGVQGTPTVFVNGVMLSSFDYQTVGLAIQQAATSP